MKFEEIMQEIAEGLISEPHRDVIYLQKKIDEYKGHEHKEKIAEACGALIVEIMPEDLKEDFAKKFDNKDLCIAKTLETAAENLVNNQVDIARELLENKIIEVEKLDLFKDDKKNEYHDFSGLIEEVLYQHLFEPKKTVRRAPEPYTSLYLAYGSLLFDLKEFDKAKEVLKKAGRWNPVNADIIFEYAEINKALGDKEKFLKLNKEAFKVSYSSRQVAHSYRNLGRYFTEEEAYKAAVICYVLSLQFEADHDKVEPELVYIQNKMGEEFEPPTVDLVEKYSKEYDFPTWASDDVINIAVGYAKHTLEKNDYETARYFLNIAYELTQSEEVKLKLAEIKDLK